MSRQRPRLRNEVDLQLQSAFYDGKWPLAMRLAENRTRTSTDPYYNVSSDINLRHRLILSLFSLH